MDKKRYPTEKVEKIFSPGDKPASVVVFISGSGTNFTAIYQAEKRLRESGEKQYGGIDAVFTNVPRCIGANKAEGYGIPVISLSSKIYFETIGKSADDDEARDYYDSAVITLVEQICTPDIIVLAGYRRRLGKVFLSRYKNRVVNLYPGDITKDYLVRGVDAAVQTIRAGENSIKCTVYLEKADERFGPAIMQSQPVSLEGFGEDDTLEMSELIRREAEWKTFPYAVHEIIAKGRLGIDGNYNLYLDGKKLGKGGYQPDD